MKYLQQLKRSSIVLGIIVLVILSVYIFILHNHLVQEQNEKVMLEEQIEELQKVNAKRVGYDVNYERRNTIYQRDGEKETIENIFVPWVSMEDKERQEKINKSLCEGFNDWLPTYFNDCINEAMTIELSTEQYLSIVIYYVKLAEKRDGFYMANTVNIQTGEWVSLDDIVEIDEEFVLLILTEGIPKIDYDIVSGECDAELSADFLARYDSQDVLKNLQGCCKKYASNKEYSTENWRTKGSFWLTEDRLYLYNVLFLDSKMYVEYEDIADKLIDKSLLE